MNRKTLALPAYSNSTFRRLTQKDILPGAVKKRLMGDLDFKISSLSSLSTTLDDGDQSLITATLSSTNPDLQLFGMPWWGLYVTSVATANILPGGSAIDESQWQIIGPYMDYSSNAPNTKLLKTRIYIRNISAGDATVLHVRIYWKYITTQSDTVS